MITCFKMILLSILSIAQTGLLGNDEMIDARDKFAANIVPQPKVVKAQRTADFIEIAPEDIKIIYGNKSIKTQIGAEEINKQLSRMGINQKIETVADSDYRKGNEKMLIFIGNPEENIFTQDILKDSMNYKELKAIPENSQGYIIDYVNLKDSIPAFLIAGADSQGSLYGAVSLGQMLLKKNDKLLIPPVSVRDWPDFKWRFLSSSLTPNFFVLAKFSYTFADIPYIGDLAAGKEYIDWALKYKINVVRLAPQLAVGEIMKDIAIYAEERGIYTIMFYPKPTIAACSVEDKKANASKYEGLENLYRNKYYLSWSRDDLLMEQYREFAKLCKLYNVKCFWFHTADTGLTSLNYAQWKNRDELDKANYGNDYGRADSHVISLIYKVFKEESPGTEIVFVTYPYTAMVLGDEFPGNIVANTSGVDIQKEKQFITEYFKAIAETTPRNFYTCLRETSRKNVEKWLAATKHPILLYFETSKMGYSICNSRARFAKTFYFKEYDNIYFPNGGEAFFPGCDSPVNLLLHAEYSWNVNQDGAGSYENYYDFASDTSMPSVVFEKIVPRCCKAFWGPDRGTCFELLFQSGIIPGLIENPEAFSTKLLSAKRRDSLAGSGNDIETKGLQLFSSHRTELSNQNKKLSISLPGIKNWLESKENKKLDPFSYKYGTMIYLFANYWYLKSELWLALFEARDAVTKGEIENAKCLIKQGRQKISEANAQLVDIIKSLEAKHLCIVPLPRGVPIFKNMHGAIKDISNKYSELENMTIDSSGRSLIIEKGEMTELKNKKYYAVKNKKKSWSECPVYSDFIVYLSQPPVRAFYQTSAQIMYDSENIYFKITMDDKAGNKPFEKEGSSENANFWKKGSEENTVEIFILPPNFSNGFYQFACNPSGQKFAICNIDEDVTAANGAWTVKTRVKNGTWTAFMTIPFAAFNLPVPQPGDVWHIGISRQHVSENRNIVFSMLNPGQQENSYQELVFK